MKDDKKDLIINIANTSFKFTEATMKKIDQGLEHIKRNKKFYKLVTAYIAFCMLPQFADICGSVIYELFLAVAQAPPDVCISFLIQIGLLLAQTICAAGIITSLVKALYLCLTDFVKQRVH